MSPTIFRAGPFRFYFFSGEETPVHVHVHATSGEAKFWLEPNIELVQYHGLRMRQVTAALRLIQEQHRDQAICNLRRTRLKNYSRLLTCLATLIACVPGICHPQIPSRDSGYTDLQRGQIERDRAAQAERDKMAQSGSTISNGQMGGSQIYWLGPPGATQTPTFIMPPRRPLSSSMEDSDEVPPPDERTPPHRDSIK